MDKERKKRECLGVLWVLVGLWVEERRGRRWGGWGRCWGGGGGMLYELSKGKKIVFVVLIKGWVCGMRELILKEYNVLSIIGG